MGDASLTSSDSDNSLLSPSDNKIGCNNAGTQTPRMSRHEIQKPNKDDDVADTSQHIAPSTSAITVYKLDAQKPLSELEKDAKTLAIPDVVVEYIKDNLQQQDDCAPGKTNPAFDAGEVIIVRTQSTLNLREEDTKPLSPISPEHRRLYCSMPRTSHNIPQHIASAATGSQPSTPKMGRLLGVVDPSISASSSSLGYPRSIPPSPNFGYRPLESETSAVYTIIAPVRYKANGIEDDLTKYNMEMEASLRKFEYNPAPQNIERRRKRLQCVTDLCSLLFLIPGIAIAILTPICLIPMFMLPLSYYIPLILVFVTSGIISVVALTFSGLLGNIVWHYDPKKERLRLRFHCGRGPRLHFWGSGFFSIKEEDQKPLRKDQIV